MFNKFLEDPNAKRIMRLMRLTACPKELGEVLVLLQAKYPKHAPFFAMQYARRHALFPVFFLFVFSAGEKDGQCIELIWKDVKKNLSVIPGQLQGFLVPWLVFEERGVQTLYQHQRKLDQANRATLAAQKDLACLTRIDGRSLGIPLAKALKARAKLCLDSFDHIALKADLAGTLGNSALYALSEFATAILSINLPVALSCNDALALTSSLRQVSYTNGVINKERLTRLLKVHTVLIEDFGSHDGDALQPVKSAKQVRAERSKKPSLSQRSTVRVGNNPVSEMSLFEQVRTALSTSKETVDSLKALCRLASLTVSGNKGVLHQRLKVWLDKHDLAFEE
jgi:hypothetical protein